MTEIPVIVLVDDGGDFERSKPIARRMDWHRYVHYRDWGSSKVS